MEEPAAAIRSNYPGTPVVKLTKKRASCDESVSEKAEILSCIMKGTNFYKAAGNILSSKLISHLTKNEKCDT